LSSFHEKKTVFFTSRILFKYIFYSNVSGLELYPLKVRLSVLSRSIIKRYCRFSELTNLSSVKKSNQKEKEARQGQERKLV
jgi:hypothetical protein